MRILVKWNFKVLVGSNNNKKYLYYFFKISENNNPVLYSMKNHFYGQFTLEYFTKYTRILDSDSLRYCSNSIWEFLL